MTAHPRVVRVLPEGTINKAFDYLVPELLGDQVRVGSMVHVQLAGRRVGAWVVADDVEPVPGVSLKPVAKVTGWGPPPELVELASWAAWRWAGRPASFLGTASPERAVTGLPFGSGIRPPAVAVNVASPIDDLITEALARRRTVLRLPPVLDPYPLVAAAAATGHALVLAPSVDGARAIGVRLRRAGVPVAVMPRDWPSARAGSVVVGARAAAWAPVEHLSAVVVLDEHDEAYQEERAPTWHARDVVAERAHRAGIPCVLVSPQPTLEALSWAGAEGLRTPPRAVERESWPVIDVLDRRREDPVRAGLYSPRLIDQLRSDRRVVCVLNRKGRARLLACGKCGEAARCEHCAASVTQDVEGTLTCRRCGTVRPLVCQACGATMLKNLRAGVARVREELEALIREPVGEITGTAGADPAPAQRVVVGTEAALHQATEADVVAFLDFDQELLAPRYRAAEQALALLVRGARLLARSSGNSGGSGARTGRAGLGRLLVQTRLPHHDVIQAALHADPTRVSDAEAARRAFLRFPPVTAMATVSGPAAAAFADALSSCPGVEVMGPSDDQWLVRAADHGTLCDALAATPRPTTGRLRVEVDPLRL